MQAVRLSLALRLGAVRGDTAPSCRKLCAEPRALHKSITSVRGWGAGCSVHEAADPSCLQWLGKERYRETPIRKLILAIHSFLLEGKTLSLLFPSGPTDFQRAL